MFNETHINVRKMYTKSGVLPIWCVITDLVGVHSQTTTFHPVFVGRRLSRRAKRSAVHQFPVSELPRYGTLRLLSGFFFRLLYGTIERRFYFDCLPHPEEIVSFPAGAKRDASVVKRTGEEILRDFYGGYIPERDLDVMHGPGELPAPNHSGGDFKAGV